MLELTDSGAPRTRYTSFTRLLRAKRTRPVSAITDRSAMTRMVEVSDRSPVLSGDSERSPLGVLARTAPAAGLAWFSPEAGRPRLGRRPLAPVPR